jgi:hypothetical protein
VGNRDIQRSMIVGMSMSASSLAMISTVRTASCGRPQQLDPHVVEEYPSELGLRRRVARSVAPILALHLESDALPGPRLAGTNETRRDAHPW